MQKFGKIFRICIIIISIFNIYKVMDCYMWINRTTVWDGGILAAQIYFLGFTIVLLLQIINILLALKYKQTTKKIICISLLIIIVTFFIPIYGFPINYPYINLYGMAIFKI